MITTERIAVPFSLANVPDPVCSKHFKCMQSSPQPVRWILRTCFTDKKTITLYWKTHSSSYPDEGAPWLDTGSLSQTGALCLRGGHRCTPGKAREPRLNNREAAETWLGWAEHGRPVLPALSPLGKRVWFIPTPERSRWKKNKNTRTQNEKGNKTDNMKGNKGLRVYNSILYQLHSLGNNKIYIFLENINYQKRQIFQRSKPRWTNN